MKLRCAKYETHDISVNIFNGLLIVRLDFIEADIGCHS